MQKSKNTKIYFGITIITLCVILFVVLAIFVKLGKVNALNDWFYNTFAKPIQNNALTNFFIVFTYLGNFFVLLIISLCFLFKKQKKDAVFLVLSLIFASILTFLIKFIIKNPRPEDIMLIDESGFSFPSAHATLSATTLTMIAYFLSKQTSKTWLKILIWSISTILVLSVCYSRIYLGVHYLTDILAGLLLSAIIITIFIMLYNLKSLSLKIKTNKPN